MMDCLYAECTPCITDCVVAELEKLGQKYRVALKVAKVRLIWRAPVRWNPLGGVGCSVPCSRMFPVSSVLLSAWGAPEHQHKCIAEHPP